MKEMEVLRALGEVDDRYLQELYQEKTACRRSWKRGWLIAAVAAAMALLMGSGYLVEREWNQKNLEAQKQLEEKYNLIDPEQVADDAVFLAVSDVSNTGMNLWLQVEGIDEERESILLKWNVPYTLEKYTSNKWEALPVLVKDVHQASIPGELISHGNFRNPVNWGVTYGILEYGIYRYTASHLEGREPLTAVFVITGDTGDRVDEIEQARKRLSEKSYHIRHTVSYTFEGLEDLADEERTFIQNEFCDSAAEIFKHGNHYLSLEYVGENLDGGWMYRDGSKYKLEHENDDSQNPLDGWRGWPDSKLDVSAYWIGAIANQNTNWKHIYRPDGTLEEIRLSEDVELPSYEVSPDVRVVRTVSYEFLMTDEREIAARIDSQTVGENMTFSWEEEQKTAVAENVEFANKSAHPISTSAEAIEWALREAPEIHDEIVVYRDEDAKMWKVEFKIEYGYKGYRYIYMDDNGITKMIAKGTARKAN